jgi:hypothetical protein
MVYSFLRWRDWCVKQMVDAEGKGNKGCLCMCWIDAPLRILHFELSRRLFGRCPPLTSPLSFPLLNLVKMIDDDSKRGVIIRNNTR